MNFFALQEQARRSSRRMVALFALAVVLVTLAVDAVVVFSGFGRLPVEAGGGIDWVRLAWISGAVLAGIGLASLYRTMGLRSGGSAVALGMGATPVAADTSNPQWRQLRNVVEEIAIASSVPVPDLYVMEHETGINAFAAGFSPADAAVCVTRGCLDNLNRDELQGVIAHEFSHVINGDMRLNIRLIGLLFGILVVGIAGRWVLIGGGRSERRGSGVAYAAMLGIALIAIGYIGVFFGRLIQAAVARSRESLADASAVQFTRQSAGIAGALKKIAVLSEGSLLQAQNTQEVSHMLFGDGIDMARMFATHPPLVERIQALEPGFDRQELVHLADKLQRQREAEASQARQPAAGGDDGQWPFQIPGVDIVPGVDNPALGAAVAAATAAGARIPIEADDVVARVGSPDHDGFDLARGLHARIPEDLAASARDPRQAPWLLLGLAVSQDSQARELELRAAADMLGAQAGARIRKFAGALLELNPLLRLPLAALAFPALRRLPRSLLEDLVDKLDTLVGSDGRVELTEYCLARMVRMQLIDAMDPRAAGKVGNGRLHACLAQVRDLLALVARFGHGDSESAHRAFLAGSEEAFPGKPLTWAWPEDWQGALDEALAKLDRVAPLGKELVVRALVRAIRFDGRVTLAEAELLRMVCASLHCPLPPLLQIDGD